MPVEWSYLDNKNTLARVSEIELDGKKSAFPQHALTHSDYGIYSGLGKKEDIRKDPTIIVGEVLTKDNLAGVGHRSDITNSLLSKIKSKMVKRKLNLIYQRIPNTINRGNGIFRVETIDDLQASSLVGIQLDLGANAIITPVPNNITQKKVFDRILERTLNEKKTFRSDKEIIGLIPKTNALDLIPLIVKDYVKSGVRHFAMDFGGATIPRPHLRTAVRAIRDSLKIKKGKTMQEKQYSFHGFNVSFAVKSQNHITPITDLLTHVYGIDSTSGVTWGGGRLVKEKLRYYSTQDYGAYRIGDGTNPLIPKSLTSGDTVSVYRKLRINRINSYQEECKRISEKISQQNQDKYSGYIETKERAKEMVGKVLSDVKEIKAT